MAKIKKWPCLYKQTTTGKVQQWTISVEGNQITTVYGQYEGALQIVTDVVREGKNLGRANATTPETQALAQATSSYEAKEKEGYVPSLEVAQSTKNTLAGVEPMLAFPIEKKEKYVTFPALAQPKLDGIRCLAIMIDGEVELFSRTQKPFLTVPHIIAEIKTLFGQYKNIVLDGELYNHRYKSNFNKITSLIKRDDVHPDHKLVQYHIYDIAGVGNWLERTRPLQQELQRATFCIRVETETINSKEELDKYQVSCVDRGYEGAIYRNLAGEYENKRSKYLLKIKTFQDAEFKIVGMEEGHGELRGHVGNFICELPNGDTFDAAPIGSHELWKEYWNRKRYCIGKMCTVKFQNYTPAGKPRFGKMKCIRDYE